jgi:hypothetical protein
MREDRIKRAIINLPGSQFERFARRLLRRERYAGLVPTSESHDAGQDARTEETTRFLQGNKWVSVFASKTSTIGKLEQDCRRNQQAGNKINTVVFATALTPHKTIVRTTTIKRWQARIKKEFGWELEVCALDFLAETAAEPKYEDLADDYLQIPPPGGDFVQEIESEFKKQTTKVLQTISTEIPGRPSPIPRDETQSVEDQLMLGKSVLLYGEAGTGKSAIALALTRSAMQKVKQVLFIDARQLGYVQNEGQLRQHFSLRGPMDEAIKRLARHVPNGVRVVIDQLDNTAGSLAAPLLTELAVSLDKAPEVQVVVVSRKRERYEEDLLRKLQNAHFVELMSHPLSETIATGVLRELGISSPPKPLVELATNLLNLSLIAGIKQSEPTFDFSIAMDEVDLWENYIKAMQERESQGDTPDRGDEVLAEATRLAKIGLNDSNRAFTLNYPRTRAQRRLVSWDLLQCEEEDIFRFRHEKLQDFIFAWDAVRQLIMPKQVLGEISEIFRTTNIVRWMQKLYARHGSSTAARFLKELAESAQIPFYTRAAALDDYIKSPDVKRDAPLLATVLGIIRTRQELRDYFFRSRPHPVWAYLLWEAGFFNAPPEPQRIDENRVRIPRWDAQEFLLWVAPCVPEVVLKHVHSVSSHIEYVSGAIQSLCLIPADLAETKTDLVASWLDRDDLWPRISDGTTELIEKLAKEQRHDSALRLFNRLAAPVPSKNVKRIKLGSLSSYWTLNAEATSKFGADWEQENALSKMNSLFCDAVPQQFTAIIEEHLCTALRLEAEASERPEFEFESRWRDSIENSGQNAVHDYKARLLETLRDTLEAWAGREPSTVRHLVERYLSEQRELLRCLAFHILCRFPGEYQDLVIGELKRAANADDLAIHHEFFQLLLHGYPTLEPADREEVLGLILQGPPSEELQRWMESSGEDPNSVRTYLEGYSQRWMRDRLWMIRDCLDPEQSRFLEALVAEQGKPEHPDFLSWSSFSVGAVRGDSPSIRAENITALSPTGLVAFLREWRPDDQATRRLAHPSVRDLATAVASAVSVNLQRYSECVAEIGLLRPEFSDALVDRLLRGEDPKPDHVVAGLDLAENLVRSETVRIDVSRVSDVNWVDVRRSIARSLASQLEKRSKCPIHISSLPRVRDLLQQLIQDSDSEPRNDVVDGESDHSPILSNTDLQLDDPITAAMTHVRPIALGALIECEIGRLIRSPDFSAGDRPGPRRMDRVVAEALTRELNRRDDSNCSAHAVYGRYLLELNWLDQEWTRAHLDGIFPPGDSLEDVSRFVAAWDSFVRSSQHRIYQPLFDALQSKYRQAIENLQRGRVGSQHINPGEGLAAQLLCDFLHGEYDIVSENDEESLVAEFYRKSPENVRSHAAWLLWDIWRRFQTELPPQSWTRIRLLWEWRVAEASRMNHAPGLDGEMEWLAHLALVAPESETLASLWPLLEGVLPHIRGPHSGHYGWDEIERYLLREVERDRVRAIRMYRLMHAQQRDADIVRFSYENERKIIKTALDSLDSRAEALAVISLIAYRGSDRHRDLYDQYAGAPSGTSR